MHQKSYAHYRARLAKMNQSGARMPDAGCGTGTGTWSFAAAEFFEQVDGCDLSPGRIAVARAMAAQLGLHETVHFQVGDVLQLPYAEDAFDFVYCYSVVISYLPIITLLRELHRVLHTGGRLFVGLNGLAWSMYLRDVRGAQDESVRVKGLRGLYNTIIHSNREISSAALHDNAGLLKAHSRTAKLKKIDNWNETPEACFRVAVLAVVVRQRTERRA